MNVKDTDKFTELMEKAIRAAIQGAAVLLTGDSIRNFIFTDEERQSLSKGGSCRWPLSNPLDSSKSMAIGIFTKDGDFAFRAILPPEEAKQIIDSLEQ